MRSLLLCTLCTLFYSFGCLAQQQAGMELSTLRIGPFKMQMSKSEAAALAKTSLKKATNEKGWPVPNIVKYNGELIAVTIDDYYGTENTSKEVITEVSTTSTKFRTKSGMGVGSTRYELLNAYKDYGNFEVRPDWDTDADKRSTNTAYFILKDWDASTRLQFKLVNNIVTEVSISFAEDD